MNTSKKNYPVIQNKKAKFNYEFIETYVAGIILRGTEIKSIRSGKASLVDSYCYVTESGEMMAVNTYVARYDKQSVTLNHEERRERKLLLNKKEIKHLASEAKNPSMTIVPVKMFINETGLCKVLIALARGKKEYDKRETIKERDSNRMLDRIQKNYK